jgi:hypothetical protein
MTMPTTSLGGAEKSRAFFPAGGFCADSRGWKKKAQKTEMREPFPVKREKFIDFYLKFNILHN